MVHVEMGEHDVELGGKIALHRDAERTHPGAGIEHERVPAREPHLDARGVPAVA